MKYVSIDIETTGLDENTCQILSVGAVIEDTEKKLPFEEIPKFHIIVLREKIQGEVFALNMNKGIIDIINRYNTGSTNQKIDLAKEHNVMFVEEKDIALAFGNFCIINGLNGKITVAGKNYTGFDKKFLDKVEGWSKLNIHRRVIDPATSFIDWKTDNELPDLKTCKVRAGVDGEVTHNAVEDAFDVIKILRTKY